MSVPLPAPIVFTGFRPFQFWWGLSVVVATGCCRNGFLSPVLKHGPRSLTYVRVQRWKTSVRNESDSGWTLVAQSAGLNPSGERSECEHTCWDPKDGELCLNRVKPGETLVEARSDSDVQIDRQTWV